IEIEGLRGRSVRLRLDELGVRGETVGGCGADEIRRVDDGLAFDALNLPEGVCYRPSGHGDEDRVGVGDVAALLPDPGHLVPGLFPEVGEPSADVARSEEHTSELQSRFDLV